MLVTTHPVSLFSGILFNMHPRLCLLDACNWLQTLSKEIWDLVLQGLALSPAQRDNGLARASRVMNVRWRAHTFPRLIAYLEKITEEAHSATSRISLHATITPEVYASLQVQDCRMVEKKDNMRDWAQTLSREVWDLVLLGLALSPGERDNGIACACRLMNVRWRAYLKFRELVVLGVPFYRGRARGYESNSAMQKSMQRLSEVYARLSEVDRLIFECESKAKSFV